MLNSRALTKTQSIILVAMIIVAVVGVAAIILWDGSSQSSDTIKIGILADLDGVIGSAAWKGAVLAVEQLNAEGGIIGKQVELVGEDSDAESGADPVEVTQSLTRLITIHKVDFVMGYAPGDIGFLCQEIAAQHKKIFIGTGTVSDEVCQRIIDEYDKYKYYFRPLWNQSSGRLGIIDSLLLLREDTGFNKIGYIAEDLTWNVGHRATIEEFLPEGFEFVYGGTFPIGTIDFGSYFAAAESAGVEVLVPMIYSDGAITFAKEYYDRQSPMFVYTGLAFQISPNEGWDRTDGKCNYMALVEFATTAGYPLTSKTLQTLDLYENRWNEKMRISGSVYYDTIRFILADAIKRAGTIETEEVIQALEDTSIETSNAKNYVFTASHCTMMGENPNDPESDLPHVIILQWQNGQQVPLYPKKIMEEAGANYLFPDWSGPWDNIS